MYQKPFGSIFGDEPATMTPVSYDTTPEQASDLTSTPEGRDLLLKARIEVANDFVSPPKVPFSREEPQFRAASTVVSDDPNVILLQSKLSLQKTKIKYAALLRANQDLDTKTAAAQVYLSTLIAYTELPQIKQQEIQDFVKTNGKRITNLLDMQKASAASKDIKEATTALDAEIKHWEELNAQKGRSTLKSFRPKKLKTSEELPITKIIPKIKGTVPMDKIAKMGKNGVITASGYGDVSPPIDQVISAVPKKEEYYIKFKNELPDQSFFAKQNASIFTDGRLAKQTERNTLLASQYEWKATDLEKRIVDSVKVLEELQGVIASKATQIPDKKVVTALSAAVMADHDKFRTGMLLDSLRSVISRPANLNGLGDNPIETLQTAAKELDTRTDVLTNLQQQILGAPAPEAAQPLVTKSKSILGLLLVGGLLLLLWRNK